MSNLEPIKALDLSQSPTWRKTTEQPKETPVRPAEQSPAAKKADAPPETAKIAEKQEKSEKEQKASAFPTDKEIEMGDTKVTFSTDKQTGTVLVKVIDNATGEVVRQIPSEEVVKFAQSLEKTKGNILRTVI